MRTAPVESQRCPAREMTRPTLSQSWGSYPAFNLVYFVLLTTSPQPMAGAGRHGWESAALWPARRQGAPSLPQIFLQTDCWPDSTSPRFPWPLHSYPRRLGTHPVGWPVERKEGRVRQRWERELFPASPRIGLVSITLERTQVRDGTRGAGTSALPSHLLHLPTHRARFPLRKRHVEK